MNRKKLLIIAVVVVFIAMAVIIITQVKGTKTAVDSQPSAASKSQQSVLPITSGNPIVNTATQKGFEIVSGIAENNVDASGKVVNDHIEIKIKNTSGKVQSNFEVFYTIKDITTNQTDAYYSKLTNFVLAAGESKSIHFDNTGQAGHYAENKYSLYHTSPNQMRINVSVSTPGYAIQSIDIHKDAGKPEKVD